MQNVPSVDEQNDSGYVSFWKKKPVIESKPRFTEMELALMEGGHSLNNDKTETFSFIKSLTKITLP
jgi:hypothetical protein